MAHQAITLEGVLQPLDGDLRHSHVKSSAVVVELNIAQFVNFTITTNIYRSDNDDDKKRLRQLRYPKHACHCRVILVRNRQIAHHHHSRGKSCSAARPYESIEADSAAVLKEIRCFIDGSHYFQKKES